MWLAKYNDMISTITIECMRLDNTTSTVTFVIADPIFEQIAAYM